MIGRHYLCDEWDNRTIRMLNTGNSNQTTRCRLQSGREENRIVQKRIGMVGYYINQNGEKPVRDKAEAITKLQAPKNAKELKSFLGSIQHLSKFINNFSKKNRQREKIIKERCKVGMDTGDRQKFRKIKETNHRSTVFGTFCLKKKDNLEQLTNVTRVLGQLSGKKKARFLD